MKVEKKRENPKFYFCSIQTFKSKICKKEKLFDYSMLCYCEWFIILFLLQCRTRISNTLYELCLLFVLISGSDESFSFPNASGFILLKAQVALFQIVLKWFPLGIKKTSNTLPCSLEGGLFAMSFYRQCQNQLLWYLLPGINQMRFRFFFTNKLRVVLD